jgi:hypothetical protein
VKLSPLGMPVTVYRNVPTPRDDDGDCGAVRGKIIAKGNRST